MADGGGTNSRTAKQPERRRRGFFEKLARIFRRKTRRKSIRSEKWYRDDVKALANHDYYCEDVIGAGTFGIVYVAHRVRNPREVVAVKRLELDDEYESREVELHKLTEHPNIIALTHYWTQPVFKNMVRKLHMYLVLDYMPTSLEERIRERVRNGSTISTTMIKVFTFQMFKGLNYLHMIRIFHRDIKPSNLLVNMETGVLKVCDFGCAKRVKRKKGRNRTYVCSRYYRAPELVLRNHHHDETIDIWAAACVVAECFRGWPLFPGKSTKHQYGAIADVLGNPSEYEIRQLNPAVTKMHVKVRDQDGTFDQHFPSGTPETAVSLLSKILIYRPRERLTALESCADTYYDHLRANWKTLKLPSGAPLPEIFRFTDLELKKASASLIDRLFPVDEGFSKISEAPVYSRASSKTPSPSSSAESGGRYDGDDLFSEPESDDVEEYNLWDCSRIQVALDDENAPLSDSSAS